MPFGLAFLQTLEDELLACIVFAQLPSLPFGWPMALAWVLSTDAATGLGHGSLFAHKLGHGLHGLDDGPDGLAFGLRLGLRRGLGLGYDLGFDLGLGLDLGFDLGLGFDTGLGFDLGIGVDLGFGHWLRRGPGQRNQ